MSAEPMSTDFPGKPFGPGDTISVAFGDRPAGDPGPRDGTDVAPVDARDTTAPADGGCLYRVTAATKILGYEPGTVFRAKLDEKHELRLLQRGQLERVSSGRPARPAGASTPGTTNEGGSR